MPGVRIIGLRKNHEIQIMPVVVDEVIEVNFYGVAQMNIPGITRVVPNQVVINLNDIMNGIIEYGPVIGVGRFVSAKRLFPVRAMRGIKR